MHKSDIMQMHQEEEVCCSLLYSLFKAPARDLLSYLLTWIRSGGRSPYGRRMVMKSLNDLTAHLADVYCL